MIRRPVTIDIRASDAPQLLADHLSTLDTPFASTDVDAVELELRRLRVNPGFEALSVEFLDKLLAGLRAARALDDALAAFRECRDRIRAVDSADGTPS